MPLIACKMSSQQQITNRHQVYGAELRVHLSDHISLKTPLLLMQVEGMFTATWAAMSANELDLAAINAEEAWQQLQDGTGIAAGTARNVLQGTQLALAKGKNP